MKIVDYNHAIDEHTRIISSLSPLGRRDMLIRAKLITSLITESLNPEVYKTLPADYLSDPGKAFKFLNRILGDGVMENELQGYVETELSALRRAQTIFCTNDIFHEIKEASQSMLDDVILPQDVFTPDGIIFLEEPYPFLITQHDTHEHDGEEFVLAEEWDIYAIMFSQSENRAGQNGIAVMLYGHWRGVNFYDPDKLRNADMSDGKPAVHPETAFVYDKDTKGVKVFFNGARDTQTEQLLKKYENRISDNYKDLGEGSLSFVDGTFFQFGETDSEYDTEVRILKKFLLSFFRLTYEYLEVERTRPDRPFQKRAKRVGRNIPDEGYVTVMTLRRKLYDGETEGATRNSPGYAFRVRGHWKRQFMPSRKLPVGDPGAYRHMYINDYIKGRGVVVRSKRVVKVGD